MVTDTNWKIPFADFGAQFEEMRDEIIGAIRAILEEGDLILRQPVAEFESNFARYIEAEHVIGVGSGSDALRLALLAIGVKPGDEVITVAHTFVATVSSIVQIGAKPVLVDTGADHNLDVSLVDGAIGERTRAIVPVHLNGHMCDMKRLMAVASDYGISVVEDAAQAIGSSYGGNRAGTFGIAGCFSFFPGKVLGAAGGYVNRCVNDIRRRPSQPLIQWRFHPHTVHRDRRLRSTQGPSDA